MPTQETINANGKKYIAALRFAVSAAWKKACEHDSIPVDTAFAVFSKTNPYEPFYQIAMTEYLEQMRAYAAGGYVGLKINAGRAR